MGAIGTLRLLVRVVPMYAAQGRLDRLKEVMATGDNRLDERCSPMPDVPVA
jgi:hypothetical protein